MNKIRTLVRAPALTQSGYGTHSRLLVFSLLNDPMFDVFLEAVPWGSCGNLSHNTPEKHVLKKLSEKYIIAKQQQQENWDLFITVTIPQEFERRGKVNIGVTAGTETDRVSHQWLMKCNEMDLIIVPSEHTKKGFLNPVYQLQDQAGNVRELRLERPILVSPEGVDTSVFHKLTQQEFDDQKVISSLKFDSDFNFLVVGQWGNGGFGEDRKNIANTVKYFIETFYGRKDVGLVLKVNMSKNTYEDEAVVLSRLAQIKANYDPKNVPPIYLVHGSFTDEEMAALYNHPQIKVMLSLTAGEGWGLPLIEAAASQLPIMVTNWSGHLDFLKDGLFIPLKYELKEIPAASVWDPVLIKGSRWAVVDEEDAKSRMEKVVKSYFKPTEWAKDLSKYVSQNFNLAKVQDHFLSIIKNNVLSSAKAELSPVEYLDSLVDDDEDAYNVIYTMPFHHGDVFISTAVVDGLKKTLPENARIYFATEPKYFDMLKGNPNVYKCIPWHQSMVNIELLEEVFDLALTPNIATQFTFSNWVRRGQGRLLAEEYANHCNCELGDYFIQEEVIEGLPEKYMTFHPSSGKGQHEARKYMDWKEILVNIKAICPDLTIVQVGAEDEPKFDEVDVDLRGKTTVNQLASVMKQSLLHLGVDSLQCHLAAAYGVPLVALYGSSHAKSTGPWVKNKENYKYVLLEAQQKMGCSKACYKHQCKVNKEQPCINEIDAFEAFQAVFHLLKTYENAE